MAYGARVQELVVLYSNRTPVSSQSRFAGCENVVLLVRKSKEDFEFAGILNFCISLNKFLSLLDWIRANVVVYIVDFCSNSFS